MIEKPLPVVDEDSQPFWEAAHDGRLIIKHCSSCGEYHFFPRAICPHCHSDAVSWAPSSGRGTIYSFTVARRPAGPAFKDDVPYAVALVQLDEGPRLMTRIMADAGTVRIGLPVEVTFQKLSDEISLPCFRVQDGGF
jgi:uncharacterized OB-fold protein